MKLENSICSLLICIGAWGCSDSPDSSMDIRQASGKTVYAVNYPLAFFAEQIAGDELDVQFPVPGDVDPAYWRPDADVIAQFQQADMILLNGADYAKWTDSVSLPTKATVDTSASAKQAYIQYEEAVTHQHGPEGEHSHVGTAFTTWLNLRIAIIQAEAIRDAFAQRWPEHAATFQSNADQLTAELEALDDRLESVTKPHRERLLLASHPVYQYLQQRYALQINSLHWEPDTDPGAEEWAALDQKLESRPADLMIWEDKPSDQTRAALEDRGIGIVVFWPMGNRPATGDFLGAMATNIENLEKALAE